VEPVYRSVVGLCLATFRAQGWDVQVRGTEHVPTTGAGVIASNHISYLDFVFAGYGVLQAPGKRLVRWAAKKETFDHPVSGPLMRAMRHIPVDRGGRASEAIEHATRLLHDGELVGMFPESTISRSFVPLPGKTGTVRMAQDARAPIVPCALWGSQRLFTKGRPRRLGQRDLVITVTFGEPLEVRPGTDPEDGTRELMGRISSLVDHAQRTHPQRPVEGEDPWWVPAHLGGSAPTPAEAEALAIAEAERRRARRAAGEG
jgi:1-acyl-sn-glycerol-3-phosphate acyltransferase